MTQQVLSSGMLSSTWKWTPTKCSVGRDKTGLGVGGVGGCVCFDWGPPSVGVRLNQFVHTAEICFSCRHSALRICRGGSTETWKELDDADYLPQWPFQVLQRRKSSAAQNYVLSWRARRSQWDEHWRRAMRTSGGSTTVLWHQISLK